MSSLVVQIRYISFYLADQQTNALMLTSFVLDEDFLKAKPGTQIQHFRSLCWAYEYRFLTDIGVTANSYLKYRAS